MRKPTLSLLAILLLAIALAGLFQTPAAAQTDPFPDLISLPNGFQPEGIVIGQGTDIYAGSLANGAIYRANLRTGAGEIIIPGQDGLVAVGLSYDPRTNYLFVSGGPNGDGRVYDTTTGELVETYQFSTEPSFINDVIVTRTAAYFTNSFQPELYRVPLGPGGSLPTDFATIPLSGDFQFIPGNFNTNGIETTPNGRFLLIVNSAAQALYRVDPATGVAIQIDVGQPIPNGDGLVRRGQTLFVVQNQLNQIAAIRLADRYTTGRLLTTFTDPDLDVPTTADIFGNWLYVVNARFGTTPGPDVEYHIVQIPLVPFSTQP
jgi:hypothetical protein